MQKSKLEQNGFIPLEKAADFGRSKIPMSFIGVDFRSRLNRGSLTGFTLIEIIIVIVIISIAALLAIPMLGNAGNIQIRAAGDMIAADLEYAKGMAVSTEKPYTVVFSASAESYSIKDANGTVITHPVTGKLYSVNFTTDSRVSQVNISSVNFGGTSQVEFNSLGKPVNGGQIVLTGGGKTVTVSVEAVTGYISVSN